MKRYNNDTEIAPEPPEPVEKPGHWWARARDLVTAALIGFLLSQVTVIAEVKRNTQEIEHIRKDMEGEKTTTNERIRNIAMLVTEQTKLATELVTLIKVQNQIQASKP